MRAGVPRVRWGEGQFVGADDLGAEQAYREDVARRHHIGGHSWGVVSGLALQLRPGGFDVGPGLAIDGYGRSLCVESAVEVAVDIGTSGDRDVWLSLAAGDVVTVCVSPAGSVDPHRPPGVPPTDLSYPPHMAVHPAPGAWPVYLGRVKKIGAEVTVDEDGRVWVTATGEAVTAPSGRARLQVGADSSTDPARFAVATKASGDPEGPMATRMTIGAAGDLTVTGATTLSGGLEIFTPKSLSDDTHTGVRFRPTATPAAAAPWTCYRTRVERNGRTVDRLVVEILHPGKGGDPAGNRFVVGTNDLVGGNKVFRPCLSVDADGTVTVHGALQVTGLVAESPIEADPADPRFAEAAAAGFVQGSVGTATTVDGYFAPRLAVAVTSEATPIAGSPYTYTVTVTNIGTAAASYGEVHVVIAIDGQTAFAGRVLANATFRPGHPTMVDPPLFDVPPGSETSELTISAVALAVGPAANVVSADAGLTATIDEHPPEP
jgi:uncharacterized repeat protein (TIGR01451 family)